MPTVLRIRSFRFHFYSNEGIEPAHIHVDTPDGECKFWLNPQNWLAPVGCRREYCGKYRVLYWRMKGSYLEKFHEYHGR